MQRPHPVQVTRLANMVGIYRFSQKREIIDSLFLEKTIPSLSFIHVF